MPPNGRRKGRPLLFRPSGGVVRVLGGRWLEYDSVAAAVLVIGTVIALLVVLPRSRSEEGRLTGRRDNQFPPLAGPSTPCSAFAGFAKGGPPPQIPKPLLWASSDAST